MKQWLDRSSIKQQYIQLLSFKWSVCYQSPLLLVSSSLLSVLECLFSITLPQWSNKENCENNKCTITMKIILNNNLFEFNENTKTYFLLAFLFCHCCWMLKHKWGTTWILIAIIHVRSRGSLGLTSSFSRTRQAWQSLHQTLCQQQSSCGRWSCCIHSSLR